jgi:hypothetical protein
VAIVLHAAVGTSRFDDIHSARILKEVSIVQFPEVSSMTGCGLRGNRPPDRRSNSGVLAMDELRRMR